MSTRRAALPVGLGDVIRCLAELPAQTEADRGRIARCLGYDLAPPRAASTAADAQPAPAEGRPGGAEPPPEPDAAPNEAVAPNLPPPGYTPPDDTPATLPRARQDEPITLRTRLPGWRDAAAPRRLPHPALLDARRSRAVLRAAVTTPTAGDAIDVERAVAAIARGEPLLRLPRQTRWRSRPVDVLVHDSEALQPYRRDRIALVEGLCRLLGPSAVDVWYFERRPSELWRAVFPDDPVYRPRRGRAVIVLSDLGAATRRRRAVSATGWRDLAAHVSGASTALILTPYGAAAAAFDTGRALPVVDWDEGTGPRDIRRAQRRRSR